MKTLILFRHAKSDWNYPELDDIDRPLNKRGLRDAPRMGKWILARAQPDLILCSPAMRTRETLERSDIEAPVEFVKELYHASTGTLVRNVQSVDDKVNCLMVLGHNPGIGHAADVFLYAAPREEPFERFPTAACAIINFDKEHWSEVDYETGKLADFMVPKRLGT